MAALERVARFESFGTNPFDPYRSRAVCERIEGTTPELKRQLRRLCPRVPGVYGMIGPNRDVARAAGSGERYAHRTGGRPRQSQVGRVRFGCPCTFHRGRYARINCSSRSSAENSFGAVSHASARASRTIRPAFSSALCGWKYDRSRARRFRDFPT